MNQRLRWIGAATLATLCFAASVALARQGVVKTREGKTIEGDIEERPDQVIVTLHGIKTAINRDNVDGQVEYFDNVEARYQDKVAKLPKKPTANDHLTLARWLFDVKAYDLALAEIEKAKAIDPNSAEAATLEQTVNSQRRIERNKPAAGGAGAAPAANTGTTPKPPAAGGPATPAAAGDKAKFLTADDINLIRQVEWREHDTTTPRVTVTPDLRRRFVDLKAYNPGEFAAFTPAQQAYFILRDGTPEMRREIKVTTDPQSMAVYRRTIQPLVLNNCATAGCHGGHAAGRFFLYTNNIDRDDVAYTNFYILQAYKQNFGEGEKEKEYSMIDRTYPEHSILAQFALHPDVSELDHPPLKGQAYKPIAVNRQAAGYRTLIGWIKELQSGENIYNIKYDLPTSTPGKVAPDAPKPPAAPKEDAPAKSDPAAKPAVKTDPTKTGPAVTTPKAAGVPAK